MRNHSNLRDWASWVYVNVYVHSLFCISGDLLILSAIHLVTEIYAKRLYCIVNKANFLSDDKTLKQSYDLS